MSESAKGNPSAAWSMGTRKRQEDFCLYDYLDRGKDRPAILLVVADGMGGQSAGDVASRTACDAFAARAKASGDRDTVQMLRDSLDEANTALQEKLESDRGLSGMGTTLLGVIVEGDSAHWISVGDSILYLLRQSFLKRLNADHSLAGLYSEQVAKGEITQAEAEKLGGHNQLRSAVMGEPLKLIDQSTARTRLLLEPGDVLLLASDGILTLDEPEIEKIADRHRHSARTLVEELIEAIHVAGEANQDNTTVIAYVHPGSNDGDGARGGRRNRRRWIGLSALAVFLLAGIGFALFFTDLRQSAPGKPAPNPAVKQSSPPSEAKKVPSYDSTRPAKPSKEPAAN